ncbi:MAG: SRPBCC family protein [Candidatus Microbacterium phytovorans]|uniref:SRPBCC family protein n=1 Tax=Candidatus Microbacterium phytovorans TaxID=3121374 RepID=A0AAJ6B3U0_9MICO|nr:SRPBCC family protein [Microbacterium sp.]WEK14283.1 MAG: SRPBCC family protein [Microbacterium sp.]
MRDLLLRGLTGSSHEPIVTIVRRYAATPDDVWSALTDSSRLARWLGDVERDADDPALVRIRFADDPDGPAALRIEQCAPAETLAVGWTWDAEAPSRVRVDLRRDGDGTILTLEHRLGEPDHVADYGGGWESHLRALAKLHGGADNGTDAAAPWALLAQRPLHLEIELSSPVADVWASLTRPERLRTWWWNHWDDVEITADARPGGAYRFAAGAAGIAVAGRYLAVEAPHRLAFTWRWSDADGESRDEACDIDLRETAAGCVLTLRHTGPWTDDGPVESYRQGWEFVFAALRVSLGEEGTR